MPRMVEFSIPQGMKPLDVAKAFNAYLIGPLAFENAPDDAGGYRHGPYPKHGQKDSWQLDPGNDFWFHFEDGKARLSCRYEGQDRIVDLMFELFKTRYLHRLTAVA